MRKLNSILAITLLAVMAGCNGNKQKDNGNDSFITVDVRKSYPKKELILQDFMDVEYIPLETNNEFINQGITQAIGKEMIIVTNSISHGDIFIYDRNGKGVRKFNRMGQGPEEYISITGIILDEENGEIFVNDGAEIKRIRVYDLLGKFKRSIKHSEDILYDKVYNYENGHLICHHVDGAESDYQTFSIISKNDGSITKEIQIPIYKEKKSTTVKLVQQDGTFLLRLRLFYNSLVPYQNNWILTEHSSDTIYRYLPNESMLPFMVRVPSIQSMSPEVFLFPGTLTDRYYFMQKFKKENVNEGYITTELVYDKKEKKIFEPIVYNGDYSDKKVSMMPSSMGREIANNEVAFWRKIESYELVEAYEKGELKDGKLKEIATKLDAEDNPVIMLVKYKK